MKELIRNARVLRDAVGADPHRPRYHLLPPDGLINDANGALFWKGRYHLFYLGRTPIPDVKQAGSERWVEIWEHASSQDLVHWTFHPPALRPELDGSTPEGIYSGDAIRNAPKPMLIYHVPAQGICVAEAADDDLIAWTPLPENPVIPLHTDADEFVVYDPCAWYEDGVYRALVGNHNRRPGYEDAPSLFTSRDLQHWTYEGPFFKPKRQWTTALDDAACPSFFPMGRKHMLLMHGHRPYFRCHYYIGSYSGGVFTPEQHGLMNWPGGALSGPEALTDDRGRVIFFGWIREGRSAALEQYGWDSLICLPRLLSIREDGQLAIAPAPELERLRTRERCIGPLTLAADTVLPLDGIAGDGMELEVAMRAENTGSCGVHLRCSPGGEEHTVVEYLPGAKRLRGDFSRSRSGGDATIEGVSAQEAPLALEDGETLCLRVYVDRSVLEVFANGRQCLTQRIYPARSDSLGVRLFSRGAVTHVRGVKAWDLAL